MADQPLIDSDAKEICFRPQVQLPDSFPDPKSSPSEYNRARDTPPSSPISDAPPEPTHPYLLPDQLPQPPTFLHDLTRLNRIHADDLERKGRLDIRQWEPLFVLGALQLPGTLAYILQHKSGLGVYETMIPGRKVSNGVCGMVVLGRGRKNRKQLDEWFGDGFVCVRTAVEIELADGAVRKLTAREWVPEKPGSDVAKAESGDDTEEEAQGKRNGAVVVEGSQVDQLGDGLGGTRTKAQTVQW